MSEDELARLLAANAQLRVDDWKPRTTPLPRVEVLLDVGVPEIHSEADLQREVFQWIDARLRPICPLAAYIFHVPNGGYRNKRTLRHLVGVKSGVPDILWIAKTPRYNGLAVELKHGYNKASQNQRDWLAELERQGWRVATVWTLEEAKAAFYGYADDGGLLSASASPET